MLARVLPGALGVLLLLAGCSGEGPDTTDLDRIAVMQADGIFADVVGDPTATQGAQTDAGFVANNYSAPIDPWAGADPPVGPTTAQRRAAVATLVANLRETGWTIISARCGATEGLADQLNYRWEAFGYRVRDGVPYAVRVIASFAEGSGFSALADMSTPFHGDTSTYFTAKPSNLAEGSTCLDSGAETGADGTIWSLDAART